MKQSNTNNANIGENSGMIHINGTQLDANILERTAVPADTNDREQKHRKRVKQKSTAEGQSTKKGKKKAQRQTQGDRDIQKKNEYLEFAKWMATPYPAKAKEGLESEAKFSQYYKVNVSTIHRWKQRSDFWEKVEKHRDKWGRSRTATVLEGLYRRAVKYGMAQEVELWLAYFEGWDKKQIVETTERFADDDLRNLIGRLPADKQQKYYDLLAQLLTDITYQERQDQNGSQEDAQDNGGGGRPTDQG